MFGIFLRVVRAVELDHLVKDDALWCYELMAYKPDCLYYPRASRVIWHLCFPAARSAFHVHTYILLHTLHPPSRTNKVSMTCSCFVDTQET